MFSVSVHTLSLSPSVQYLVIFWHLKQSSSELIWNLFGEIIFCLSYCNGAAKLAELAANNPNKHVFQFNFHIFQRPQSHHQPRCTIHRSHKHTQMHTPIWMSSKVFDGFLCSLLFLSLSLSSFKRMSFISLFYGKIWSNAPESILILRTCDVYGSFLSLSLSHIECLD